ncbi:hypothetical protein EI94DRAFT_1160855 [Lactarius quietus]|nr:hypothetical protein EI94DRAFT_1160855 [Lactarius quietus]
MNCFSGPLSFRSRLPRSASNLAQTTTLLRLEEWISDKTRFAYDGLRFQRLTIPLSSKATICRYFMGRSYALTAISVGFAKSGRKETRTRFRLSLPATSQTQDLSLP